MAVVLMFSKSIDNYYNNNFSSASFSDYYFGNYSSCTLPCKKQQYACRRCYNYYFRNDAQHQDLLPTDPERDFDQCVECERADAVPTPLGCSPCPAGCARCFEGNATFNFTAFLVWQRPRLSL